MFLLYLAALGQIAALLPALIAAWIGAFITTTRLVYAPNSVELRHMFWRKWKVSGDPIHVYSVVSGGRPHLVFEADGYFGTASTGFFASNDLNKFFGIYEEKC